MAIPPPIRDLPPLDAIARWPASEPLAVWWSGQPHHPTILARPQPPSQGTILPTPTLTTTPQPGTWPGGWIGLLSYALGHQFEPTSRTARAATSTWPLAIWFPVRDAYIHDPTTATWSVLGSPPALLPQAAAHFRAHAAPVMPASDYQARVEQALRYIRSGDIYQANIAHRLQGPFEGSARAFLRALLAAANPWHGGYLEWDTNPAGAPLRSAVVSASPELLLRMTGDTLETRPMKGTRRVAPGAEADLHASPKDRAELAMIVDLMRNDLGRVCAPGSVQVASPREIEHHARAAGPDQGILQATATIRGRRRPGVTLEHILRAVFPAGSVTGAPKVRAMQIIDELESVPRGPYCGSLALLSHTGDLTLNVAIRTALIQGPPSPDSLGSLHHAALHYSVGAGIVADSDPAAEWQETLDKAGVLRRALASAHTAP